MVLFSNSSQIARHNLTRYRKRRATIFFFSSFKNIRTRKQTRLKSPGKNQSSPSLGSLASDGILNCKFKGTRQLAINCYECMLRFIPLIPRAGSFSGRYSSLCTLFPAKKISREIKRTKDVWLQIRVIGSDHPRNHDYYWCAKNSPRETTLNHGGKVD